MFTNNKHTIQVLFICLFTACFFVTAAAVKSVALFIKEAFGLSAMTACALAIMVLAFAIVRQTAQAMERCRQSQGRQGVVIFTDTVGAAAACAAVLLVSVWDASASPYLFFGTIAACVMFCASRACRYNRDGEVYASLIAQLCLPLAAPLIAAMALFVGVRKSCARETIFQAASGVAKATVFTMATDCESQCRVLLKQREERSSLTMMLAVLPLVLVLIIRLTVGANGGNFLFRAFMPLS